MNSSIVQSATQTSSVSSTGEETYVTFTDLVKRYGDRIAKQMRAEKRRLQEGQGASSSDPPYVMAHPDLPGNEDCYMWKNMFNGNPTIYYFGTLQPPETLVSKGILV